MWHNRAKRGILYIEGEGKINLFQISNFKFQIPRQRSGYTLVEMVVVMGIMAVMMLLAASAFVALRGQHSVDQTAKELLNTVRTAQNKSISVTNDAAGNDSKVWVTKISDNDFGLLSLYLPDGALVPPGLSVYEESSSLNPNPSVKLSVYLASPVSADTPVDSGYIYYATPFGTAYASTTICATSFRKTTKPTEEWDPTTCGTRLTDGQYLKVLVTKDNHTSTVIIKENGDSYIE